MSVYSERTVELFWDKVAIQPGKDSCWLWTASFTGKYGQFRTGGAGGYAHVTSWEIANGRKVAPGKYICHTCDNQACVRPSHLYEGTHAQNTADAVERKRMASGNRHWTALNPDKVSRGEAHSRRLAEPETRKRMSEAAKARSTPEWADRMLAARGVRRAG